MNARELLDTYASRPLPDHLEVVGFDDTAQTFAPEAFAALRAVLDLHKPDANSYFQVYCDHCIAWGEGFVLYPCGTVRAIARALEAS